MYVYWGASLVAQMIKNPSAMWETWVQSLAWEDLLEKRMATHSSIDLGLLFEPHHTPFVYPLLWLHWAFRNFLNMIIFSGLTACKTQVSFDIIAYALLIEAIMSFGYLGFSVISLAIYQSPFHWFLFLCLILNYWNATGLHLGLSPLSLVP